MSDVCVCGHSKSYHENWPRDCGSCPCAYRPVLDWPDSEGWWWMHTTEAGSQLALAAFVVKRQAICIAIVGVPQLDYTEQSDAAGPARFTKLLEPNPFPA